MPYWTETNNKFTNVQCVFDDVFIDIGTIEKPYSFDNVYIATGANNETLRNGDSFIFNSFEDAYNKIVEVFEGSFNNGSKEV